MANRRGVPMSYSVRPGEAFVGGKTRENAGRLLDLAHRAGLNPRVVRTTSNGFIVPVTLLDLEGAEEIQEVQEDPEPEQKPAPKAKPKSRPRSTRSKKESAK